MKTFAAVAAGAYLVLAIGNKVAEAAGARRCHCPATCWCRRPGLDLFRWVFPWHAEQPPPADHQDTDHAVPGRA